MEPNELKEAQSDFDKGLDDAEERNRRIRALELDPDWDEIARFLDVNDIGYLLSLLSSRHRDDFWAERDRFTKSWATWVVDSQRDKK